MAGKVVRFVPMGERRRREGAALALEQLDLLPKGAISDGALSEARIALRKVAQPDGERPVWAGGFCMISRDQTAMVWDAIRALPPSARPNQVRHAFDLVLLNLRHDTGEVMLTRDQLAEKIGCDPSNVSHVMCTLEAMGVIRRERRRVEGVRGRGVVVYFINPHVGWNGSLKIREEEAAVMEPPSGPLLRLMQGGKA